MKFKLVSHDPPKEVKKPKTAREIAEDRKLKASEESFATIVLGTLRIFLIFMCLTMGVMLIVNEVAACHQQIPITVFNQPNIK